MRQYHHLRQGVSASYVMSVAREPKDMGKYEKGKKRAFRKMDAEMRRDLVMAVMNVLVLRTVQLWNTSRYGSLKDMVREGVAMVREDVRFFLLEMFRGCLGKDVEEYAKALEDEAVTVFLSHRTIHEAIRHKAWRMRNFTIGGTVWTVRDMKKAMREEREMA